MTIIFALVYIALTAIVLRILDYTKAGWFTRILIVILVNGAVTLVIFEYISEQFDWIINAQKEYYQKYDDVKKGKY